MKINVVLGDAAHSGGVQMIFEYLNNFVECGEDVVCYVCAVGYNGPGRRFGFIKSLYRLMTSSNYRGKWFDKKFVFKIVPIINNYTVRNADITIATSWPTSFWVYKLNKDKGKKCYFIQGFETWGSNIRNQQTRKSYRLLFDLRITVSTELHDRLIDEENCESIVICNGIKKNNIVEGHNFNKAETVIGMPYREPIFINGRDLKNSKGGTTVLLDLLKNKEVYGKSFGFSKPSNWNDIIEFCENPTRKQLEKWYDSIDVFYVPSLYEGWGLPAMEAMSRGCVVVASNTGCIKELGIDNNNCYVLNKPEDAKYVADFIWSLIQHKDSFQEVSNNAIATMKDYTFEISACKFRKELQKLVQG